MRGVDYSGKHFGRWEVIEPTEICSKQGRIWLLRCVCGTERKLPLVNILGGHSKSCGCLRHDAQEFRLLPNGDAAKNMVRGLYRIHATKRGLSWDLTDEQFSELTASNCHYCGVAPGTVRKKKESVFVYNGIDRKDSSLGYTVGNVLPCCPPCNHAKSDMPYALFMDYLDRMCRFHRVAERDDADTN